MSKIQDYSRNLSPVAQVVLCILFVGVCFLACIAFDWKCNSETPGNSKYYNGDSVRNEIRNKLK